MSSLAATDGSATDGSATDGSTPGDSATDAGAFAALAARLVEARLLYPVGVTGLYGRSATYQSISDAVDGLVTRWGASLDAEMIYFPPIIARSTFEHTNYLESFPDLMGSVHIFTGDDRDHRELLRRVESDGDWPALLEPADVVLSSAACHSLYPLVTGTLPAAGRYYEVRGTCFRHEPSLDPARMQSFGMHEVVFLGEPADAQRHRDEGLAHGLDLLSGLKLAMEAVPANDPFFGRLGTVLAAGQLDEQLKMADGDHVGQLPSRPLRCALRHLDGDRRRRPQRLRGLRGGPDRGRPVARARSRARALARGGAPAPLAVRYQLLALEPARYEPHALHDESRTWLETNCAADLWIEVLHALGHDPTAGLAFALSTDFDGEQWRMFKYPAEDLRRLYGVEVHELNVWRPLTDHLVEELSLGHLVSVDVDAWWLPDTAGLTYRCAHQKTTLMAQMIDTEARTLGYFHNAGYFEVDGEDYTELLSAPGLPPYVESVHVGAQRPGPDVLDTALALTRDHLARRPDTNPITRFAKRLEEDLPWLAAQDVDTFHRYAFGTVRQCGANAELAASFVDWLAAHDPAKPELADVAERFRAIATGMKSLEFMTARAVRGRVADLGPPTSALAVAWQAAMDGLAVPYGT
jgi:hypothetical protein